MQFHTHQHVSEKIQMNTQINQTNNPNSDTFLILTDAAASQHWPHGAPTPAAFSRNSMLTIQISDVIMYPTGAKYLVVNLPYFGHGSNISIQTAYCGLLAMKQSFPGRTRAII